MCEKCEEEQVHPDHPLIKIRNPGPWSWLRFSNDKNDLDVMLESELIKSSIPDEFEVRPGQEFTK